MPEVSEVALTAEILSNHLKNKKLVSFDFVAGRFTKKSPPGFEDFIAALPLRVKKIDSKGKFLWFDLIDPVSKDKHWYIFNTFGLTGMWSLFEPNYTKAVLTFSKDKVAYFSDMRNFGTFKFTSDPAELRVKLNELGPDFLKEDNFDLSSIKKYKIPVVKILMDQNKVGSGIGNYLVAEILYRAKISPHRLGNKLSNEEIENLTYWIKYVTKLSYINNHIGYMENLEDEAGKTKRKNYHPDIKIKDKEFEFLIYRKKIDPDGNKVKADIIIKGRTTYWVPAVQK